MGWFSVWVFLLSKMGLKSVVCSGFSVWTASLDACCETGRGRTGRRRTEAETSFPTFGLEGSIFARFGDGLEVTSMGREEVVVRSDVDMCAGTYEDVKVYPYGKIHTKSGP